MKETRYMIYRRSTDSFYAGGIKNHIYGGGAIPESKEISGAYLGCEQELTALRELALMCSGTIIPVVLEYANPRRPKDPLAY